jgi:hypothetical protein
MKNILLLLAIGLCALPSTAQQPTTTDRAIEGAKVLVEIIKLIQKEKDPNPVPAPCTGGAEVCFENKTKHLLHIELKARNTPSVTYTLATPPNNIACKMDIPGGLYEYKVLSINPSQLLLAGDMRLKACQKEVFSVE